MSTYDDMFRSATYHQEQAEKYEKAWLQEVARVDQLRDMYERAVAENSEFRAQILRQAETIKYLQREVERAYSDDHSRTGRVVDALQFGS